LVLRWRDITSIQLLRDMDIAHEVPTTEQEQVRCTLEFLGVSQSKAQYLVLSNKARAGWHGVNVQVV